MTTSVARAVFEKSAPAKKQLRVLIVEDSVADGELLFGELGRCGFDVVGGIVQSAIEFRSRIKETLPNVILADYNLGDWRGMDVLEILRQEHLDVPLILISGALGDETAVDCIKQGAADYVLKSKLGRLPGAILRALHEKALNRERTDSEHALALKVEELARSNRDLEQFAYIASHDLQEPLRMVSAYTQLLSERYKGKLDEQADKYIHYAVDGATRMQDLIQDLLRFSRVGREGISLQSTDCNEALQQAVRNLKASIDETGTTLHCKPLPTLMANGPQLQQVFQNLISNALKFRDGAVPMIEISAQRKSGNWEFSVSDNGIGIAPEHGEIIFSIFRRLNTRAEYVGNGIGLSICKKIIEQLGGKIWLANHSGPGCTISFSIPETTKTAPNLNE